MAIGDIFGVTTGHFNGLVLGPHSPYFGEKSSGDIEDVWLEFDERGILKRVEAYRKDWLWAVPEDKAWRRFTSSVPDTRGPEEMRDQS